MTTDPGLTLQMANDQPVPMDIAAQPLEEPLAPLAPGAPAASAAPMPPLAPASLAPPPSRGAWDVAFPTEPMPAAPLEYAAPAAIPPAPPVVPAPPPVPESSHTGQPAALAPSSRATSANENQRH